MTTDIVPISHYEPTITVIEVIWRSKSKNTSFIHLFYDCFGRLLSNSTDIEPEFVDIVNENFWDLI